MVLSTYSALSTLLLVSPVAIVLYVLGGAVYRLYLSPLAKFPGPKLAALTQWYEFYYDVVLEGQYTFHIKTLHEKYGPIIRINPWELHVYSPHFHEELYAGSNKIRDKWAFFTKKADAEQSTFSTTSHAPHRKRRAALNPFFSTASVNTLQPVISQKVQQFLDRIRSFRDSGEVLVISDAFAAFANDVVNEYSFSNSQNRVAHPTFDPDFHHAAINGLKRGWTLKHFNFILRLRAWIPEHIAVRIHRSTREAIYIRSKMYAQVQKVMAAPEGTYLKGGHKTIFHEILGSSLPPNEKSVARLAQEAFTIIPAGTISTSWTLSVGTYHILASPTIMSKLRAELSAAYPDADTQLSLVELTKLDYLTGCILEALRLSYGISTRNQRIAPEEDMMFTDPDTGKKWSIPRGTPTGMSTSLIHHDETIFPNSHEFVPERWLDRKERERLGKYMVSFGRGTRSCLGINLAYAELYLLMANLFRLFGGNGEYGKMIEKGASEGTLALFQTDERDVRMAHDMGVAVPWENTKGVRVKVLK
ncbi:putative cytochrome P450 [Mollisia scopiformis]|uniref:Putative cytochrome P450 n=1 Tax=Mollisia scopiformis TaxID=149040 RepID=A0A194XSW2_MOLSC|nr:putative cytochrome P450 [Mollisia scopiformis]KUJ23231.1 putative cytochrome P450 [Mollisia scopiformis]